MAEPVSANIKSQHSNNPLTDGLCAAIAAIVDSAWKEIKVSVATEERVDIFDGKYSVILRSDGSAQALRYGEYWPGHGDSLHDNLTLALAREVIEARAALSVALGMLFKYEPGDSRAVSDEFVALASVQAGIANGEARAIILRASELLAENGK